MIKSPSSFASLSYLRNLFGVSIAVALLTACSANEHCPIGLVVAGKVRKITLPGGGAPYVANIDLGAIDNETTYNKVSEKVADLTQLMSLCCERKITAQKAGDQAGFTYWSANERKCFDQFLELQAAVKGKAGQGTKSTQKEGKRTEAKAKNRGAEATPTLREWMRHVDQVMGEIKR